LIYSNILGLNILNIHSNQTLIKTYNIEVDLIAKF